MHGVIVDIQEFISEQVMRRRWQLGRSCHKSFRRGRGSVSHLADDGVAGNGAHGIAYTHGHVAGGLERNTRLLLVHAELLEILRDCLAKLVGILMGNTAVKICLFNSMS